MKLIFLNCDGLSNEDCSDSIKLRNKLVLRQGVIPAIKLLNKASIRVVIFSTPIAIGRQHLTAESLENIHDSFKEILRKHGAFVDKICTYTSTSSDNARLQPNPGLFIDTLNDFQVKPHEAVLIGDTLWDLEAATTIKCPRVLVRTGKGIETLKKGLPETVLPVTIFNDLYEAVTHLLNEGLC